MQYHVGEEEFRPVRGPTTSPPRHPPSAPGRGRTIDGVTRERRQETKPRDRPTERRRPPPPPLWGKRVLPPHWPIPSPTPFPAARGQSHPIPACSSLLHPGRKRGRSSVRASVPHLRSPSNHPPPWRGPTPSPPPPPPPPVSSRHSFLPSPSFWLLLARKARKGRGEQIDAPAEAPQMTQRQSQSKEDERIFIVAAEGLLWGKLKVEIPFFAFPPPSVRFFFALLVRLEEWRVEAGRRPLWRNWRVSADGRTGQKKGHRRRAPKERRKEKATTKSTLRRRASGGGGTTSSPTTASCSRTPGSSATASPWILLRCPRRQRAWAFRPTSCRRSRALLCPLTSPIFLTSPTSLRFIRFTRPPRFLSLRRCSPRCRRRRRPCRRPRRTLRLRRRHQGCLRLRECRGLPGCRGLRECRGRLELLRPQLLRRTLPAPLKPPEEED